MGKEFFTIEASRGLVRLFDEAARQTGHGRGRVFTDFLTVVRCSLAGQTMEEEYLDTISKGYVSGDQGKRGVDTLKTAFHQMIDAMEDTGQDVLGDVFQGAITYGENGQFFTPDSVCQLMGGLSVPEERTTKPKTINDPACGSGRQLLAVAKKQPHWEFTGQDVDHRCAQMTAINLALNGLHGWSAWQNTLTLQTHRVYKIGFNRFGGVIREVPVDQSSVSSSKNQSDRDEDSKSSPSMSGTSDPSIDSDRVPAPEAVVFNPDTRPGEPTAPSQMDLF